MEISQQSSVAIARQKQTENLQLQEVAQQPVWRDTEYQIAMATQPDWEKETMAASQAKPRVQVIGTGEKSAKFGIR